MLAVLARHLDPPQRGGTAPPRTAPTAGGGELLPSYRVAMVGAGRYANVWARAWHNHPRCTVVAVADTDANNAAVTAKRFDCPAFATYN